MSVQSVCLYVWNSARIADLSNPGSLHIDTLLKGHYMERRHRHILTFRLIIHLYTRCLRFKAVF
jgi:hypothetical protein